MSSPRRSSRQQRQASSTIRTTGPLSHWRSLNQLWRQHYIDLGHCRISRCTRRIIDATDNDRDELRSMNISFVALAISAAASVSGRARVAKVEDLRGYITAAIQYNLHVNDDHNGESAVELAAYHGMSSILIQLLDEAGCPLQKRTSQRNAIFAAIRNGQHESLEIILSKRKSEAQRVIREEEHVAETTGKFYFSLLETIMKGDAISAHLLLSNGCASMTDRVAKFLFNPANKKFKRYKKLEGLLQTLYPTISNVMHWQKELHWSFPTTDRETMNWLWNVLHHRRHSSTQQQNDKIFPDEILLRIFGYCGRGWFACRIYEDIGYSSAAGDILERNVID